MGSTVLLAFFLALVTGAYVVVLNLGFGMVAPLAHGLLAGIIVGDINLGLQIGATCALLGLGFYTYGGATIPDYNIGAVFGVFVGKQVAMVGGDMQSIIGQATTVATAIALLMSLFDILGRGSTTIFQHGGDNALARRNLASFQRWHLAGTLPWALSRVIPVFIGMLFIDRYQLIAQTIENLDWLQKGLAVVGASLPAVGFALLLSFMDISRYWPYMLAGFVLFAYMNLPTVGLAIVGAAAAGLYIKGKKDLAMGGN